MNSDRTATRPEAFRGSRRPGRAARVLAGAAVLCAFASLAHAQAPAAAPVETLGCAAMEEFLKTARVVKQRDLPVGVTVPRRATLDDGRMRHDAAVQATDVTKPVFETRRFTELNFRDSWKFNVAGYELAKILQLNMVPPYVEREVEGLPASVSWWIDDAIMGRDQYRKKLEPPDGARWSEEMQAARVFHQLIYDTDANLTNLLITKDWRLWMIDFSRAFRITKGLRNPNVIVRCDRRLLANLRALSAETLEQKLGRWLTKREIVAVLARRDLIVRRIDEAVARRGESAVLYDLPRTAEPCGTGLR